MGFSITSWKYLGQNYDRLHNKNNNNNAGKEVYNRNSLGKSLFWSGPPKKSVINGNGIKGKHKMMFDKLRIFFIVQTMFLLHKLTNFQLYKSIFNCPGFSYILNLKIIFIDSTFL